MSGQIPVWGLLLVALAVTGAAGWMFSAARAIKRKGDSATKAERDLRATLVIAGFVTVLAGFGLAIGAMAQL